ncbi:MAG: hypothetical protein L0H31_04775, partial [Nocardioidaceae bacterium]|nr:hypothetical protein [Nocardioidaceae bacterium]
MQRADVDPEVRALSRRLLSEVDQFGVRMAERIREEIPVYAVGAPVSFDDLTQSCSANVAYILGVLAGDEVNLDSPRATGAARAEQRLPYAAVLQAFRIGGRFIWELLVEHAEPEARDVLLRAAADVWSVSDDLAAYVTDAYRGALADRARRDGQMRAVLVGSLLDGDGEEIPIGETAGLLDLGRGGEYVVVSAESPAPGAEGLLDVERALRRSNVVSAWRLDHDHHEGVVGLRPGFGVDKVVEALSSHAAGRVGVSR